MIEQDQELIDLDERNEMGDSSNYNYIDKIKNFQHLIDTSLEKNLYK